MKVKHKHIGHFNKFQYRFTVRGLDENGNTAEQIRSDSEDRAYAVLNRFIEKYPKVRFLERVIDEDGNYKIESEVI